MIIAYIIAWFGLMIIGVLNGILRAVVFQKIMTEIRAHQFSSLTAIIFLGIAIRGIHAIWPFKDENQALGIGLLWTFLTVLFEFGFGHYVMKHPWEKLLREYRIDKGRVWSFVLLWILFAPWLIYVYTL